MKIISGLNAPATVAHYRLRDLRESPVGLSTLDLPWFRANREGVLAELLREADARLSERGCAGAERVRAEAMREAVLAAQRDASRNRWGLPPVDAVCALLEIEYGLFRFPCDQEWHETNSGKSPCIHLLDGDVSLCGRADGPREPWPAPHPHLPPVVVRTRSCGLHEEGLHRIGFTPLPKWVTCSACLAKGLSKGQAGPGETDAQRVSRRLREDEAEEMLQRATTRGAK